VKENINESKGWNIKLGFMTFTLLKGLSYKHISDEVEKRKLPQERKYITDIYCHEIDNTTQKSIGKAKFTSAEGCTTDRV
jgi:hypothetical protein